MISRFFKRRERGVDLRLSIDTAKVLYALGDVAAINGDWRRPFFASTIADRTGVDVALVKKVCAQYFLAGLLWADLPVVDGVQCVRFHVSDEFREIVLEAPRNIVTGVPKSRET